MSARAGVAFGVLGAVVVALGGALLGCGRPATEPRLGAAATTPATPMPAAPKLLDDFEDVAPWRAVAADGVRAEVHGVPGARGQALRLDFDLSGTSGYAVARRALPLDLTGNFELTFELRGEAPVNNFELKLVDASGENVWWYHRRDQELSGPWRRVVVKKRQIEFAWGPTTDKTLRQIAAIEVVIAAGRGGGAGWIELDDLTLRALPSYAGPPPAPVAEASSALPAHAAARAVDGDPDTAWRTGRGAGAAELTLDLGRERDLAGLLVRWGAAWARRYQVETSLDGARWQLAAEVEGGDGGVDLLPLGEVTARHVRLRLRDGGGADGADGDGAFALAELELLDAEGAPTTNELLAALARRLPRGALPRAFRGEQAYWTVVGVDGGADSGLFSEDGALELRSGGPSVEPALTVGGETVTWADVRATQALEDGDLPIPRVTWRGRGWELEITALAAGARDGAELAARYVLRNRGAAPLAAQLALAVRPLQVNPPTQFLNVAGGVAPLTELAWAADDGVLLLDGQPALRPLPAPDQVTLHPFHALDAPLHRPPPRGAGPQPSLALRDRARLGSAALRYDLRVAPGRSAEVVLTAPLLPGRGATTPPLSPAPLRAEVAGDPALAGVWFTRALTAMKERWRGLLDRVALRVPPAGAPIVETLRSSLAYMLISRDGPMLRPGTRSYARAWIRDGAMISEALLRLGHPAVAAAFLRWYAPYQYASGKVPCCVDAHGAGPVPEHDSQGQLMYLAHLVYRYGRDRALARAVWPSVLAAAD
ncbi:MAG: discoidin domain-containing protein, partial [Kofleriaceae bacterium]